MSDIDRDVTVPASDLRLWRDTLRHSVTAQSDRDGVPAEPGLLYDTPLGEVSLAERIIAMIESHLIRHEVDWPEEAQ